MLAVRYGWIFILKELKKKNCSLAVLNPKNLYFSPPFPFFEEYSPRLSGWRVDRESHVFEPLMSRDMLTLVSRDTCERDIQSRVGSGAFSLSESERCALRTRDGARTCAGHVAGGAGLVCQSQVNIFLQK